MRQRFNEQNTLHQKQFAHFYGEVHAFHLNCTECGFIKPWVNMPQKVRMPCGHIEWKAHTDITLGCMVTGTGFEDLRKQHAWQ